MTQKKPAACDRATGFFDNSPTLCAWHEQNRQPSSHLTKHLPLNRTSPDRRSHLVQPVLGQTQAPDPQDEDRRPRRRTVLTTRRIHRTWAELRSLRRWDSRLERRLLLTQLQRTTSDRRQRHVERIIGVLRGAQFWLADGRPAVPTHTYQRKPESLSSVSL